MRNREHLPQELGNDLRLTFWGFKHLSVRRKLKKALVSKRLYLLEHCLVKLYFPLLYGKIQEGNSKKSMREQRTKLGGLPAGIGKTYREAHDAYIKIRRFVSTFIFKF
jgi:hypothetical protein